MVAKGRRTVTLNLPDEMAMKLRVLAVSQDRTVSSVIEENVTTSGLLDKVKLPSQIEEAAHAK